MKSMTFKFYLLLSVLALSFFFSLFTKRSVEVQTQQWSQQWIEHKFQGLGADALLQPYYYNKEKPNKIIVELGLKEPLYFANSGYGGVEALIRRVEAARQDERVVGLLVRVNSPGGTIAASQELFEALKRFRAADKQVVASVMDLAASGAYYAILPAQEIIGNRGSLIGSIGVLFTKFEVQELLKKIGVSSTLFKSVPHKDFLSPSRPLTPFETGQLQKVVDQAHRHFLSDVIEWRQQKSSSTVLTKAANGLLYPTADAIRLGLVDSTGDFETAKQRIATLTGLDYKTLQKSVSYKTRWVEGLVPLFNNQVQRLTQQLLNFLSAPLELRAR